MAHLTDYVKWRGDLTFAEREFKEEDNLVLSELAYIDFSPVMEEGMSMTLTDAVDSLRKRGALKITRAASTKEDEEFACICAGSRRFGDIVLSDFKDITDVSEKQFAAITYILGDGSIYIAYRGTDNTIIGWKEDFMISYTKVPSQELALIYVQSHIGSAKGRVMIGGHSKGANLALFAAAHLDEEMQEKVDRVYVNDGPGFCEDVTDGECLKKLDDKIIRITPEYSVVGRIFEISEGKSIIVKSSAVALMQHNMHSWEIDGDGLVTCTDHAPESYLVNDLIGRFVGGMELKARANFVDSLFDSMAETGAVTINDFTAMGPSAFENIMIQMVGNDAFDLKNKKKKIKAEDDENRGIFSRAWGLINRKEIIRVAITLFLSVLCFCFPDFAMESAVIAALVVICIYEVVLTVRHLKESDWNFRKERPRVMLCITLWVLSSSVFVKEGALLLVATLIVGIALLALAYQNVINFRIYNNRFFERFRYSFEGIVTFLLGGYLLITPELPHRWYMISCGTLLMIDTVFELVKIVFIKKRR
ncbi:MAG: DUF2974 domain-containing protein [Butyrivibrio sp.]|nr:DUF2974 domain-containing protein [Butyrivibrio sp.]